jgi:hypothetical protein
MSDGLNRKQNPISKIQVHLRLDGVGPGPRDLPEIAPGVAPLRRRDGRSLTPTVARQFATRQNPQALCPRDVPTRSLHVGIPNRWFSSGLDTFGLGFRPTWLNGDLHCIFHWVFERHFDSEQSVLVGSFGFVRFHRPT